MSTSPLCHTCRKPIAGYESIHYGSAETGYRDLCNRCFNEEVARLGGLKFEHVQFDPIEMTDTAGEPHRFQCCVRLNGEQVALEVFELKDGAPGGYIFEVLGDPEGDLFALMAQLIERMRRALARRHLELDEKSAPLQIAEFLVRGRIDCDVNEEGRRAAALLAEQQPTEFERLNCRVFDHSNAIRQPIDILHVRMYKGGKRINALVLQNRAGGKPRRAGGKG